MLFFLEFSSSVQQGNEIWRFFGFEVCSVLPIDSLLVRSYIDRALLVLEGFVVVSLENHSCGCFGAFRLLLYAANRRVRSQGFWRLCFEGSYLFRPLCAWFFQMG